MSVNTEYFSMQGRVAIGVRNADGSREPAQWVYDASKLEWAFSVDKDEREESYSGQRGLAATLIKKKSMKLNLTLGQLNDSNAALAVAGKQVKIDAGTVTAETIGTVKAGDMVALDYAKVSSVALTGSGSATLEEDTDYTLNATTGVLTFLTANEDVSADYEYAAHSLVTVFSGQKKDLYILFDGMNTVDGTEMMCLGEVYRASLEPASTLGLIQDGFGDLELAGDALIDSVRLSQERYGGYARLKLLAPETP
jgi:hypothetical protein